MSSNSIIVIGPDGKEYKSRDKNKDNNISLCRYLEKNEMCFPNYKNSSSDLLSLYLSGLSYVVLLQNNGTMTLYIGEVITDRQKNWLLKNKNINNSPLIVKSVEETVVNNYSISDGDKSKLINIISNKVKEYKEDKMIKRFGVLNV